MSMTTFIHPQCGSSLPYALVARALRGASRKANFEGRGSISGLTDDEAKEFHQFYVQGLVGFTAIAVIAHILVWAWRPWFY
ncbi:MAG: hypothetical protein RLZZ620_1218 [Pseudomonadota bacterium]